MSSTRPFQKNPILTAIAMGYRNGDMIADQVLPRVTVGAEQFKYSKYGREDFQVENDAVGRAGRVNEIEFSQTQVDGSVSDHGLETPIPDSDIANAKKLANYDPRRNATLKLTKKIVLNRERRVASAVFNQATYPASNRVVLSGTSQWSDKSASTPVDDVWDAKEGLIIKPNVLVLGFSTFSQMIRHPSIVKAANGNSGDSGAVSRQQLAEVLGFKRVLVGDGWANTGNKGQAESLSYIWGKHAAMLYIDEMPADTDEITFGFTASFGDRVAMEKRDDNIGLRGGVRIRVGESVKEIISAADVGFFFENAVA